MLPLTRNPLHRWSFLAFALLGLTLLALPFDAQMSAFFATPFAARFLRPSLTFLDFMGGYSVHVLCFTIVMATVPKARTAVRYLIMMGGSTVLFTFIKIAVGRARPGQHLGAFVFHPFSYSGREMDSFPSGQACSAMALATVLGLYFPKGRWWFWAIATVTAVGRVAERRHFPSDVIFGAGVGLLFVLVADRRVPDGGKCGADPIDSPDRICEERRPAHLRG